MLLVAALAGMQGWRQRPTVESQPSLDAAFASAVDSARSYEDESRRLLNELAMQRAMMGPATAASFDGDLPIIGKRIAEKAKAAGIDHVAFDRAGFAYHGRIKALADAAREAGLKF